MTDVRLALQLMPVWERDTAGRLPLTTLLRALNLFEEPRCRVTIGKRVFDALAEPLEATDHGRAIAALILRYGTPAESLGIGPTFRLRPVDEAIA